MTFKSKWRVVGSLLLLIILLAVGVFGSGCVGGLAPIGWSGGAVDDDNIFVGTKEGRLVSVGLTDESLRFGEALKAVSQPGLFGCSPMAGGGCGGGSAGVAIYGTPVIGDGRVYIAGYNGKVYSYFTDSMQLDEVYPAEDNLDPIVGGLAIDEDNVYLGVSDGTLYALDAENLIVNWTFKTDDKIWGTPAVVDGTVYIGSFDKKLYAVNAADGTKKWEFLSEGAFVAKPLVIDNTVYVGSFDRNFYALDAATGSVKWQFFGQNWFWAEALMYDGKIYAGCLDNNVYVLDAGTGSKVAEFNLGSPISSAPVIVEDSVVFATREGVVYVIDTASDSLRQIAEFEKKEVNGPLAAHEGIVYIHTQELTLERVNIANGATLRSINLGIED